MEKVVGITALAAITGVALIATTVFGSKEKKSAKKRTEQKYRKKDDEDEEDEYDDEDDDEDVEEEQERKEREKRRHEREEREWWANERRKQHERERRQWQVYQERKRREQEESEWWVYQEIKRREQHEREMRANEERERHERQERERRANEERERRERQEMERRANEEREQRGRQERERRASVESERREQEERERKEKAIHSQNEKKQEASQGTSSGASQPPQENRNNNDKDNSKKKMTNQDYFDIFMRLLRRLLKAIYGPEEEPISKLFDKLKLTSGQKKYLIKVVKTLENFDTLEAVLEIVIIIFKDHMSSNINFENFLSLLEFVRSYLNDKVNEIQTEADEYIEGTYEERRARILHDVMTDSGLVVRMVVLLFRQLAVEIAAECAAPNNLSPDFRDTFAKVYHYYKHRRISYLPDYENENIHVPDEDQPFLPEYGILSIRQYFYWARKYLAKLKSKEVYKTEVKNASSTVTFRYEVFVVLFGRRLRIVVKVRDGKVVLSTIFFDDNCYPGDPDDFEDLDIQKK